MSLYYGNGKTARVTVDLSAVVGLSVNLLLVLCFHCCGLQALPPYKSHWITKYFRYLKPVLQILHSTTEVFMSSLKPLRGVTLPVIEVSPQPASCGWSGKFFLMWSHICFGIRRSFSLYNYLHRVPEYTFTASLCNYQAFLDNIYFYKLNTKVDILQSDLSKRQ